LIVFRTRPGFRGGCSHRGDDGQEFPGKILVEGETAQGAAGRAGGGPQIIATMKKDQVFSTHYSGRLYGGADCHYYLFDGEKIVGGLTREERDATDLF